MYMTREIWKPRFHLGQYLQVVRLLDDLDLPSEPSLIGYKGIVTEILRLWTGEFAYIVDDRFFYQGELEPRSGGGKCVQPAINSG
jgi:hypothetical protein